MTGRPAIALVVGGAALACGGIGSDAPDSPAEQDGETGAAAGPKSAGPESADSDAPRVRAVERAVNEKSAGMHECWGRAAAEDLGVEGTIVLELAIGEGGEPEEVEVIRDTSGEDDLRACVVSLWEDYAFPADAFEAGEALRLPPFRFAERDRQFAVPERHVPRRELGGGAAARVILREENTGNPDASIARIEVESGRAIALPAADGGGAIALATEGEGRIFGPGLGEGGAPLEAEDAAYAPAGAAPIVEAAEGDPLVLVVVFAPAGPEAELERAAARGASPEDAGRAAQRAGPSGEGEVEIVVRREGEADTYSIAAGLGEAAIYFGEPDTPEEAPSLAILTGEPGMVVPPHTHEEESEYLYLLRGRGEMRAGGDVFEVTAGVGLQVPPGVEHGVEIAGESALRAVQIYAPAGPEMRFAEGD